MEYSLVIGPSHWCKERFSQGWTSSLKAMTSLRLGAGPVLWVCFLREVFCLHLLPSGISGTTFSDMNSWIEGNKQGGKPERLNILPNRKDWVCYVLFWLHHAVCILVPWSGISSVPLHWEHGVLTTELPRKSLQQLVFISMWPFLFKTYF